MLQRPRFRPHLRVEVVPGEGVFLLSPAQQSLLRGRLYELVAPCLDGRTADELCDHLKGRASAAEVYYALGQLERKQYLCEEQALLSGGEAALWSSQGVDPAAAALRLAARPVAVRALGFDAGPFVDLLRSLHVRAAEGGRPDVVLTDSYVRPELEAINAEALAADRPWLLVRPSGRQVWIGPLFRPGATGCWQCLVHRLRANTPVASYLARRNGHGAPPADDRACTPATLQVAWGLAANAVAAWVVRGEVPELDGKVQTCDVPSWKLQTHTLVRLPFCPACGRPGEPGEFRPPAWESRKKTFTADGGHRVITPEETLARYLHHVSPITGAVSMLERANPAESDGVLHVYFAGNNTARPHHDLAELRGDLRHMCAGKGVTEPQARASGLCEGLERYSGVFRSDEPRRRARMSELDGAAVDPRDCLLFSERQYREREARNADGCRFSFIPAPFNPEAEVEWSPVWSLTRQAVRYVPTALAYYDYPLPRDHFFCTACSNGCAGGNTIEEAVVQGFLELVERDSVALWWYSRVRRPGVNLDSFGQPYLAQLQAFLRGHGREYWVIDLTADLGIPAFASVSRCTRGPQEQIVLGFGAHLDARIALLRAVTEMNQMLSSPLLKGEEMGPAGKDVDPETARWLRSATIENQSYLLACDEPPRTSADYPRQWHDEVSADIRVCQERVEAVGLEMLMLDQTRPEVGLPVARVFVPGLRHFWTRFAPGRLYDVPVQLGWLSRPLAEEELNPIAMFL
jgi:ribosomal protein S12 methylthiotransferase accessory factor